MHGGASDDGMCRTVTKTHDLMTKPSKWEMCIYAGKQHCPCEGMCAVSRKLLEDGANDEAQLTSLEDEVRRNGFEHVLVTVTASGEKLALRDVAAEKAAHPQNRPPNWTPQSPAALILNQAELLAIMLYTGSEIQGGLRQDMMASGGRWPILATTIERALKKQRQAGTTVKRNHFDHDLVLYHGLHGVNVLDFDKLIEDDGTFSMTFSIGTVVSASYVQPQSPFSRATVRHCPILRAWHISMHDFWLIVAGTIEIYRCPSPVGQAGPQDLNTARGCCSSSHAAPGGGPPLQM
jgi:hypothetical protein